MLKRNILFSVITTISRLLTGFLLLFVLARYLSLSDFGVFTFSLVLSSMMVLVVEYGYNIKLSKDTARHNNKISELATTSMFVKLSLIFFVLGILFFIYTIDLYNSYELYLIVLMTFSSLFNSFANHFLIPFKSVDRFDVEARYVFANNISLFIIVSIVAMLTGNVEYIIYCFILVKFIYMVSTIYLFDKEFGFNYVKFNLIDEYKHGLAFALHVAIGAFYLNVDTLILKQYVSLEQMGIYQAGLKALGAATIVMAILNSVLLPKLTCLLDTNKLHFNQTAVKFNLVSISLGLIVAVIINIYDKELINLIFGKQFAGLAKYVFLFSIIIFLRYFGLVYGILLTISEYQKVRTYGVLFTLIFIVVCDLFIVPVFLVYGALVVSVIAHIILTSIYIFFIYREYKTFFFKREKS